MTDIEARPTTPQTKSYRLGGLQSFIPLNEELGAVSTRGQRLPSLLQSRSSTSLFNVVPRRETKRRSSSFTSSDEEDAGARDGMEIAPRRRPSEWTTNVNDSRRLSAFAPDVLMTPQIRSMRLIGKSNPRYRWHQYYKTEEQLKQMSKPVRKYYERCNYLIAQYIYIDKLLDSSLPHTLIQEYSSQGQGPWSHGMDTISEESPRATTPNGETTLPRTNSGPFAEHKVKRTPKNIYKLPEANETSPLLQTDTDDQDGPPDIEVPFDAEEAADFDSPAVTIAIYINLVANVILLAAKIAVIVLTDSLSVLASLVDGALDFLSTAIVWSTTKTHLPPRPIRLPHRSPSPRARRRAGLQHNHDNLLLPSRARMLQPPAQFRPLHRRTRSPRRNNHALHRPHQRRLLLLLPPHPQLLRASPRPRRAHRRRLQHLLHNLPLNRLLR